MSARPARRKLFIVVYYSVFVVIIFYRSFYCFFGKHRTVHFVSGKSVKRFGNTSSSHATLIAAESGGIYALSVQGSGLVYGTTPDIAEQVTYVDDLTGSAAYKKYLAGIVFTLGR